MIPIGAIANTTCENCGDPFTFESKGGRTRQFCDECRAIRRRVASEKFYRDNIKLEDCQQAAYAVGGLNTMAKCSQEHAAVMLSVMETLELQAATGDPEAFVAPISKGAVQQIERKALSKIKKAMAKHYTEYRMTENKHNTYNKTEALIHD